MLLPPVPRGDDETRALQHPEVLGDGLAGHLQTFTELPQRLAAVGVQRIEQRPPVGVGESAEHLVHHISDQATIWLPFRQ